MVEGVHVVPCVNEHFAFWEQMGNFGLPFWFHLVFFVVVIMKLLDSLSLRHFAISLLFGEEVLLRF